MKLEGNAQKMIRWTVSMLSFWKMKGGLGFAGMGVSTANGCVSPPLNQSGAKERVV